MIKLVTSPTCQQPLSFSDVSFQFHGWQIRFGFTKECQIRRSFFFFKFVYITILGSCWCNEVWFNWYAGCVDHIFLVLNTLWQKQNGRHFADDIFKYIFLNANEWILINISLTFVPKGPVNNIPTLVQIMAWYHPGVKPFIWTNDGFFTDAYIRHLA